MVRLIDTNDIRLNDVEIWGKPKSYTTSFEPVDLNGLHRYLKVGAKPFFMRNYIPRYQFLLGDAIELNGNRASIGRKECFNPKTRICYRSMGLNWKIHDSNIIKLRSDLCLHSILIPFSVHRQDKVELLHLSIDLFLLEGEGLVKDFKNNCTTIIIPIYVYIKCVLYNILMGNFTSVFLNRCLEFYKENTNHNKALAYEAINIPKKQKDILATSIF